MRSEFTTIAKNNCQTHNNIAALDKWKQEYQRAQHWKRLYHCFTDLVSFQELRPDIDARHDYIMKIEA